MNCLCPEESSPLGFCLIRSVWNWRNSMCKLHQYKEHRTHFLSDFLSLSLVWPLWCSNVEHNMIGFWVKDLASSSDEIWCSSWKFLSGSSFPCLAHYCNNHICEMTADNKIKTIQKSKHKWKFVIFKSSLSDLNITLASNNIETFSI